MSKIQLRGHCQLCGRIQAANERGLAKHGYTIKNRGLDGWFHDTCGGSHKEPLEKDRSVLDATIKKISLDIVMLKADKGALESGKSHPNSYDFGDSRKSNIVKWEDMADWQRSKALQRMIFSLRMRIQAGEGWIRDMLDLAEKVHGNPVMEVNVAPDQSKVINVGDKIKTQGQIHIVTRIQEKAARGVGPSLNGQFIEHVFWNEGGKEFSYPKRLVRKVV